MGEKFEEVSEQWVERNSECVLSSHRAWGLTYSISFNHHNHSLSSRVQGVQ